MSLPSILPGDRRSDLAELYRPPRTRAKWVTGAFVIYLAINLWLAFWCFEGQGLADRAIGGDEISDGEYDAFDARGNELYLASFAASVLVVVAFCMWTHRVAKNALSFGAPLRIRPGMAVGYYFIPILNLWRPYSALKEVWLESVPPGDAGERYAQYSPPFWFLAWWLLYLGSGFLERWASRHLERSTTMEEWSNGLTYSLAALAFDTVAAGLCLLVVWRLTQRQEIARGAALPAARVVD